MGRQSMWLSCPCFLEIGLCYESFVFAVNSSNCKPEDSSPRGFLYVHALALIQPHAHRDRFPLCIGFAFTLPTTNPRTASKGFPLCTCVNSITCAHLVLNLATHVLLAVAQTSTTPSISPEIHAFVFRKGAMHTSLKRHAFFGFHEPSCCI